MASKTAELIEQNGFPSDKRLGAGVVDGRSVWADGDTPSKFVAALLARVGQNMHVTCLPRFLLFNAVQDVSRSSRKACF